MSKLMFVTLKTKYKTNNGDIENRNVTIEYSERLNKVSLLGNLEHNTELIIDQKLVNDLQKMVNAIKA